MQQPCLCNYRNNWLCFLCTHICQESAVVWLSKLGTTNTGGVEGLTCRQTVPAASRPPPASILSPGKRFRRGNRLLRFSYPGRGAGNGPMALGSARTAMGLRKDMQQFVPYLDPAPWWRKVHESGHRSNRSQFRPIPTLQNTSTYSIP